MQDGQTRRLDVGRIVLAFIGLVVLCLGLYLADQVFGRVTTLLDEGGVPAPVRELAESLSDQEGSPTFTYDTVELTASPAVGRLLAYPLLIGFYFVLGGLAVGVLGAGVRLLIAALGPAPHLELTKR